MEFICIWITSVSINPITWLTLNSICGTIPYWLGLITRYSLIYHCVIRKKQKLTWNLDVFISRVRHLLQTQCEVSLDIRHLTFESDIWSGHFAVVSLCKRCGKYNITFWSSSARTCISFPKAYSIFLVCLFIVLFGRWAIYKLAERIIRPLLL